MRASSGYAAEPLRGKSWLGAGELETVAGIAREAGARGIEEAEPCAALWAEVLRRAIDDFAFLLAKQQGPAIAKADADRLRHIREDDPVAFFTSPWFEEICAYLGLAPDSIRPSKDELQALIQHSTTNAREVS